MFTPFELRAVVEEYLEWLDTYRTPNEDKPTTADVLARCLSLPGASAGECNFDTAFTPSGGACPGPRRLARSSEEPAALILRLRRSGSLPAFVWSGRPGRVARTNRGGEGAWAGVESQQSWWGSSSAR